MRTHAQIIRDAGAAKIAALPDIDTGLPTVNSWAFRSSIPAKHWVALVDAQMATLDELAKAAADQQDAA